MDPDIAVALRREGIDVTTTVEAGLRTADDADHLTFIRRENRVLVTDDARLVAHLHTTVGQTSHPGVVCCRRDKHSIGQIIRFLILMHQVYDTEDMIGCVEYL